MEINYKLTIKDCISAAKEKMTTKYYRRDYMATILICMLFSLLIFFYILFAQTKNITVSTVIGILGGLLLFFISIMFVGCTSYLLFQGQDKSFKIILEDNYIKQSSLEFNVQYNLNKIIDIFNKKNNILIFVTEKMSLIIPKRAFQNKEEMNNFWNKLEELYNKSRNEK